MRKIRQKPKTRGGQGDKIAADSGLKSGADSGPISGAQSAASKTPKTPKAPKASGKKAAKASAKKAAKAPKAPKGAAKKIRAKQSRAKQTRAKQAPGRPERSAALKAFSPAPSGAIEPGPSPSSAIEPGLSPSGAIEPSPSPSGPGGPEGAAPGEADALWPERAPEMAPKWAISPEPAPELAAEMAISPEIALESRLWAGIDPESGLWDGESDLIGSSAGKAGFIGSDGDSFLFQAVPDLAPSDLAPPDLAPPDLAPAEWAPRPLSPAGESGAPQEPEKKVSGRKRGLGRLFNPLGLIMGIIRSISPGSAGQEDSAPEDSAPEGLGPEGLGPEGLGQEGLGQEGSAPEGLGQEGSAPEFLAQELSAQEDSAQEAEPSLEAGFVPAVSFSQSPEDFLREMAQEQGKDPEIFEFAPGGSFGRLIASDSLELLSCQEDLLVPAPEKSLGIRLSPGRAHFEGGRSEAEDLSLISLSSEPRGLGGYCQEGGLAPFPGEAFGAPMAFGDLDLYDLEVTSRSVIFSILRRGRESLFRKLEAGPVSEMRFLRQLAEDFELSLSWALAGMETALREASQALFGGGLSLLNLPWPPDASPVLRKLSGDFEASLSGYSAIIQKRAAELDRAATAVAWKALALAGRGQILEREADLLAKLSKLGLESFCLDLFHFIRTAMELSTLCLIDAGGVFGLGPARGPERLGQAFLRKIKAEPKDFEGGLEDLRRALGKMAGSFSLMADRSLTGRLRVLMAARGAAAFDWLELISVLRDMESRIIRLHWLAIIDDWGQCAGSARDIRRLIEFGPGRFCGSLMRVLSSLARIWEILQSFRRESQGPEPQAPTITNS